MRRPVVKRVVLGIVRVNELHVKSSEKSLREEQVKSLRGREQVNFERSLQGREQVNC